MAIVATLFRDRVDRAIAVIVTTRGPCMKQFQRIIIGAFALALPLAAQALAQAPAQALRPDQAQFRALYQELVETDTSITTGSCTTLADKIEVRLRAAGFTDGQITRFAAPDHPKEGGIVVVLPGSAPALKALLLLGHLDVVAAKREDWTRDPYKMVEEGGYFYGRGTLDMKADGRGVDRHADPL